jgi:hypothetical protein
MNWLVRTTQRRQAAAEDIQAHIEERVASLIEAGIPE